MKKILAVVIAVCFIFSYSSAKAEDINKETTIIVPFSDTGTTVLVLTDNTSGGFAINSDEKTVEH